MARAKILQSLNVDGEAMLFNVGIAPFEIIASSTTGCIAVRDYAGKVTISNWHFRAKGSPTIRIEGTAWIAVWSCQAPWNASPAGYLVSLTCDSLSLNHLEVRSLRKLRRLDCSRNNLTELDLSDLTHLRGLDCAFNNLKSLKLTGCLKLTYLKTTGNSGLRITGGPEVGFPLPQPSQRPRARLTRTSLFDL